MIHLFYTSADKKVVCLLFCRVWKRFQPMCRKDNRMTEQELKKLSRADLLAMLLEQSKENDALRSQLSQMRAELDDKAIRIENAGSIAEAALQLNGIFEAAQAACAQYTDNIRTLAQKQEALCAQMERESAEKCEKLEQETTARCEKMILEAKTQSQTYWDAVSQRIQAFSDSYAGLRQLLEQKPEAMKQG